MPDMSNMLFFMFQTLIVLAAYLAVRNLDGWVFVMSSAALIVTSSLTSFLTFQRIRHHDKG
jgi:hypothetical protein